MWTIFNLMKYAEYNYFYLKTFLKIFFNLLLLQSVQLLLHRMGDNTLFFCNILLFTSMMNHLEENLIINLDDLWHISKLLPTCRDAYISIDGALLSNLWSCTVRFSSIRSPSRVIYTIPYRSHTSFSGRFRKLKANRNWIWHDIVAIMKSQSFFRRDTNNNS